jgi:hypothetical protein
MIGFVILVLLFLIGIWIYVELAKFPGKRARERGHPQADAINVLSWIGLLFGAVPWLVALVWAYMRPIGTAIEMAGATAPQRSPAGGAKVESEGESLESSTGG